jgi:hypothetical protein
VSRLGAGRSAADVVKAFGRRATPRRPLGRRTARSFRLGTGRRPLAAGRRLGRTSPGRVRIAPPNSLREPRGATPKTREIARIGRASAEWSALPSSIPEVSACPRRTRSRRIEGENLRQARAAKGFLLSAHIGAGNSARSARILATDRACRAPLDNPLSRASCSEADAIRQPPDRKRDAGATSCGDARGETVAILVDQNVLAREAVFVPFFGRPAATTPALALFQLKTDAAVVPVFTWPEGGGRYRLEFEAPIFAEEFRGLERAEAVRAATARYMEVTEAAVRKAPEAWLWMHNRWRTRPGQATGEDPGDQA